MLVPAFFFCVVAAVTDGASLGCLDGKRIRLHAIEAPAMPGRCRPSDYCAPGDPFRARAELQKLALGQTLRCKKTGMSGIHATAYCSARGVDLSCAMYRAGYAHRLVRADAHWRRCRLDRR